MGKNAQVTGLPLRKLDGKMDRARKIKQKMEKNVEEDWI